MRSNQFPAQNNNKNKNKEAKKWKAPDITKDR